MEAEAKTGMGTGVRTRSSIVPGPGADIEPEALSGIGMGSGTRSWTKE